MTLTEVYLLDRDRVRDMLDQRSSNLVLGGHCPLEFSSNPDQTHLPVSF